MRKCLPLILLFILYNCLFGDALGRKHIIGSRPCGFFSNFNGVINNLYWCERNNVTPVVYWGKRCLYFVPGGYNGSTNPWEYYFEQVSDQKYNNGENIHHSYAAPGGFRLIPGMRCVVDQARRKRAKFLIDRYIKLKPNIQKKIDDFYASNMEGRYTIGIHLRGTDKGRREVKRVSPERIMGEANQQAARVGKNCQFFVASDEKRLLEIAKKHLNGRVIFYDVYRSENNRPLHYSRINRAQHGEEVLIEVQLLARCDYFIHTVSNVSCSVRLFNPELRVTCLR